jgi:hypothetical protein
MVQQRRKRDNEKRPGASDPQSPLSAKPSLPGDPNLPDRRPDTKRIRRSDGGQIQMHQLREMFKVLRIQSIGNGINYNFTALAKA